MRTVETMRLMKTERLSDPSLTAGERAYLIGTQDGAFPDTGWHVPGEMGGLWTHPIKLLDGFWLRVDGRWLERAAHYISGPFWSAHTYDLPDGLRVTRRQFAPDGEPAIVARYTFHSPVARTLRLRLLARSDLQAVWFSKRGDPRGGSDRAGYDDQLAAWVCRHATQPWFAVVGTGTHGVPLGYEQGHDLWGPERTAGSGVSVALEYELAVPAGGEASLECVLAGSYTSREDAVACFERVRRAGSTPWHSMSSRYEALLARSVLDVPDAAISAAWDWAKCDNEWLVRHVPEWGRGLGAGVADYPWWFGCDNGYALLGCLALGQHEIAIDTLDLLRHLSVAANGASGRVIHECNTWGDCYNHGNTQEAPQFVSAVWHTYLWTGDRAFLERSYDFCTRAVLEWTLGTQCLDGDLWPYGYGIIEVDGLDLQCLDTAAHTVAALAALAEMAAVLGDDDVATRCRALHGAASARLDDAFWMDDEGLYGDMRASPAEMTPRLRRWMRRARELANAGHGHSDAASYWQRLCHKAESDPEQDRKRPWLCKNWTTIAPLELGLTAPERAGRVLQRIETPEFSGRWGMYLSGVERGAMMSINTGALAVAELAYGRVEKALEYVGLVAQTLRLRLPGAVSEMSPDGGCCVQAWSGYSVAWPLATQVFGLRPDAARRRLTFAPTFPVRWSTASLRGVRIGDTTFDLAWDGALLTVTAHAPGWTVTASGVPLRVQTDY